MFTIFISSVQKELAAERKAVRDYVRGDALLRRYFDVFLFEELPATNRKADDLYLEEVDRAAIYLGIFGNEYGFENSNGISPTEREFDRATLKNKYRVVLVKGADDKARNAKMNTLIRKAEKQLVRRRFNAIPELMGQMYASLVYYLEQNGTLRQAPFDAVACHKATMNDISAEKVRWFVERARQERQFALTEKTATARVLIHLNLLDHEQPSHGAILLFGNNPQKFLPASEVKCLHFHGEEISKPIPSYQLYKGTVFDLVDQAVDFVMSKITRSVGTRAEGAQAPVDYELPKEAVAEAIVNAVAHRDYTSNASVQVMLFANRLEVWNPGELPPALTPEGLRKDHASIPHNPLIAEPLFLAHYIEKAGTGTLDMIKLCAEASLPEPDFTQKGGQFVITLWRDWLTEEALERLELNERQRKAVLFAKQHGRITNSDYKKISGTTDRTALRDFEELMTKGVIEKVGTTGRATYYVIKTKTRHKPDKPDTLAVNNQTRHKPDKGDRKGPKGA
jgi:ATP-dependent DNA helicase RecG